MAVPVALADLQLSVNLLGQGTRLNLARPRTQPHRPAEFLYPTQLPQLVNHAMGRRRIELARVRFRQSHDVARKFDASRLHPQTDSEVRNFLLPRIPDCDQHAFNAALAESAG